MLFFKPTWMSKNEDKAFSFVENLSDQTMLMKAAADSPHDSVRCSAVSKLTDQEVLCGYAVGDPSANVRKTAVELINDQKVIADVAIRDTSVAVRAAAIEKLNNQDALYEVAMTDPSTIYHNTNSGGLLVYHLRLAAIQRITSQKHLYEIATHSEEISVCATAAKCLTEEKYLCAIVIQYILSESSKENDCAGECCRAAMQNENLNNQKLFENILQSSSPYWLKCIAIQKINNKELLLSVAKNDPTSASVSSFKGKYYPLREEAQRRLLYLRSMNRI